MPHLCCPVSRHDGSKEQNPPQVASHRALSGEVVPVQSLVILARGDLARNNPAPNS